MNYGRGERRAGQVERVQDLELVSLTVSPTCSVVETHHRQRNSSNSEVEYRSQ